MPRKETNVHTLFCKTRMVHSEGPLQRLSLSIYSLSDPGSAGPVLKICVYVYVLILMLCIRDPQKVEWWNCGRNRKPSCNDKPATAGLLHTSAFINIIPLLWVANPSNKQFRLWCGQPNLYLIILDLSPGGFWLHLFNLQSLLSLSIKVQEVCTITLNLACRIRALLPPIVNCCKKLRGFNTAYRGNTPHEYFEVQEGSELSSRSAYFQFHLVRFWYHQTSWTYMEQLHLPQSCTDKSNACSSQKGTLAHLIWWNKVR